MGAGGIGAIVCGILCVVCIFVAVERYQANAASIEAMNQLGGGLFGSLNGGGEVRAGIPAATKYAIFFAILSGGGAIVFLATGSKRPAPTGPSRSDD